jgi:hypothetical protein
MRLKKANHANELIEFNPVIFEKRATRTEYGEKKA